MSQVLDGIRVLEAANFVSGPYVGQLLADLGAQVTKIENPRGGDPFRGPSGYGPDFQCYNPHKRSVALDISKPAGAAVFKRLAADADVVIENFRPGVMDKLGLGWTMLSALNPRLVYCAITGFGQDGPYRHRPAYDSVAGGISGFLSQFIDPEQPQITGPAVSDAITGLYGCYGVLGALIERHRTGRGRRVDVTMVEAMIAFLRQPFGSFFVTGKTPGLLDRPSFSSCFSLRCADDKLLAIHISSPEKFWENLTTAAERPELRSDPRFATRQGRIENYRALTAALAPSFLRKSRGEWMALLDRLDVPFAPINDFVEVMEDPQIRHLGTFATRHHAERGDVSIVNPPLFFDGKREIGGAAPPILGEHTDAALQSIGLSVVEIAALRADHIIA
jgi:crotonobetainyl-CoA:carnitine CoA-transferase CaiB-like acyl-CoA transferase